MSKKKAGVGRVDMLSSEESRRVGSEIGLPDVLADLNIFRTLQRSPKLAKAASDLLLALLFQSSLDHRLRELVIMRIGWATGADYEWTQHWTIAQERFGCSADELLALRDWRGAGCFGEAERAVLEATDETLETGTLSAETWRRCREHVGDEVSCMELVASIATWRWISQLTRSLQIPLEDGVASWPPDGRSPAGA